MSLLWHQAKLSEMYDLRCAPVSITEHSEKTHCAPCSTLLFLFFLLFLLWLLSQLHRLAGQQEIAR